MSHFSLLTFNVTIVGRMCKVDSAPVYVTSTFRMKTNNGRVHSTTPTRKLIIGRKNKNFQKKVIFIWLLGGRKHCSAPASDTPTTPPINTSHLEDFSRMCPSWQRRCALQRFLPPWYLDLDVFIKSFLYQGVDFIPKSLLTLGKIGKGA